MFEAKSDWKEATLNFITSIPLSTVRMIVSGILVILGLVVTGIGISELYQVNDRQVSETTEPDIAVCEKRTDFERITVYVSGAVEKPGLYVLEEGSRKADAVALAGGLNSFADTVAVHKQVNFAAVVSDGENVYIPNKAEVEEAMALTNGNNDIEKSAMSDWPISINTSDAKTLEKLDGVGTVRAQKIIENRPFESLEQLVNNGILSESIYEKNKEKIVL